MSGPLRLGVIGAGNVTERYLPHLATYPDVEVVAIASRDPARAAERAAAFGIPTSGSTEQILGSEAIEAVLVLTPPAAHREVALEALRAGKHVYNEKPLAMDPDGAREILDAAADHGLVVGSAPDVILTGAFQASLRQLADGRIGSPVFARAEAVLSGPERWHPSPAFLYARGGGPLFDIGPYYLTAVTAVLGSVASVVAQGTRATEFRTVGSGPLAGTAFPVEVPTLVAAVLEMESGVSASLLLTFDSSHHRGGWMEVFGRNGTLRTPDPNGADLDPSVLSTVDDAWHPIEWAGNRDVLGPGVVNFARHIRGVEPLVVSAARAAHTVEVMTAIAQSADSGERVRVSSRVTDSPLLPPSWDPTRALLGAAPRTAQ